MLTERDYLDAVWHAKCRADYRHPDAPGRLGLTRRRCMLRARSHETAIINIAIRVENALRRQGGGSPETPPVPKNQEVNHGRT